MIMLTQRISYLLTVALKVDVFQMTNEEMSVNFNSLKLINKMLFQFVRADLADFILKYFNE